MLCASVLAGLEAAVPVEKRILPPSCDASSVATEESASNEWSGDQRVHADVLDSLESGMALALHLPTGARGSELKKMHMQSLGYGSVQEEKSGLTFECLKLTAFETKTK
jgi:hypothetical protein